MQGLQDHLAQSDKLAGVDIAGMFPDAYQLRAELISRAEIKRVYAFTRQFSNANEMRKLGTYVISALGSEAEKDIDNVPVLPSKVVALKRSSQRILTVAKSPAVIHERVIAKRAVSEFTGRHLPNNLWFDDDYVTAVHIARSGHNQLRAEKAKAVTYLDLLLRAKGELFLPEAVRLEAVRPTKPA